MVNRRAYNGRHPQEGTRALALLLDTREVSEEDREPSLHETFLRSEVPRYVSLTAPLSADRTRIEAWMLGSMMVFSPESPGLRVVRSPSLEPMDPIVALLLQNRGTALFNENGEQQRLEPGSLTMARPTAPNEYVLSGQSTAFQLPFDQVGLPFETVRAASERLPSSPLFPLVCRHLTSIREEADSLDRSSAAGFGVAAATTILVRALLVSAVEDERDARTVLSEALLPRVLAYVRQHLAERDLTPTSIARAHNISVRYLYKICDAADIKLMEWILEARLEGARANLMCGDRPPSSIANLAHSWGFKDPSHFSRRFRQVYGVSPRDLLRQSRRSYRDQI